MKFPGPCGVFLAGLLCFTPFVRGQNITELVSQIPSCALNCVVSQVNAAGCSITDAAVLSPCLCTNYTLLADITGCVRQACTLPDQVRLQGLSRSFCHGYVYADQSRILSNLAILALALAIPSIVLRWLARYQSSRLSWDDYTALAATVVLVALASIQIASVSLGFGRHIWDIDPVKAIPLLEIYWVSQQFYIIDQLLIKVSTLLLYLRVFPRRWFRITVMVGIALMIAQDTTYTFLVMIRCLPVPAIWDARVSGKCINLNIIGLTGAIVGITEHFIILLLPLPELWKLKLSRRKRVQLALVFMVGSFSCITSLVRLKYVSRAFAPTQDISWDIFPVLCWSLVEELSAVVCINLPPCRHFISRALPGKHLVTKVLGTAATNNNYNTKNKDGNTKCSQSRGVTEVHMHRSVVLTESRLSQYLDEPGTPGLNRGEITTEITASADRKSRGGRPKSRGASSLAPLVIKIPTALRRSASSVWSPSTPETPSTARTLSLRGAPSLLHSPLIARTLSRARTLGPVSVELRERGDARPAAEKALPPTPHVGLMVDRRPHTAHGAGSEVRKIDVEIDQSALGLPTTPGLTSRWSVYRPRWIPRSPRSPKIPKIPKSPKSPKKSKSDTP